MLKETCGIVGTFSTSCNWHSAISHPLPPLHNAQQKKDITWQYNPLKPTYGKFYGAVSTLAIMGILRRSHKSYSSSI